MESDMDMDMDVVIDMNKDMDMDMDQERDRNRHKWMVWRKDVYRRTFCLLFPSLMKFNIDTIESEKFYFLRKWYGCYTELHNRCMVQRRELEEDSDSIIWQRESCSICVGRSQPGREL